MKIIITIFRKYVLCLKTDVLPFFDDVSISPPYVWPVDKTSGSLNAIQCSCFCKVF